VRRICWNSPKSGVAAALADLGARQWQIEIVAPILETALLETEPLAIAESEPDSDAQVPEQV
jgi:ribonuclease D